MASRRADVVTRAYAAQLAALRAAVRARIDVELDDLDFDDVTASFDAFAARIQPLLASGQASVSTLAAAFVRRLGFLETGELHDVVSNRDAIAGTTAAGESLASGMAAWGPMVLQRIGAGASIDEARDFGRYVVQRFTDGEITGAADRELRAQGEAVGPLTGWQGIVSATACDACQENDGDHELDWTPYRHGNCGCVVVPIFESGG